MSHPKMLLLSMPTVFILLIDSVPTVKTCGKLLYEKRLPTKLKKAIFRSKIQTILHGSEVWCIRGNNMKILQKTENYMVRAMCVVHERPLSSKHDHASKHCLP